MTVERATVKATIVALFSFLAVPLLEWLRVTSEMDVRLSLVFIDYFEETLICFAMSHFP
jgi:hypothetical protein